MTNSPVSQAIDAEAALANDYQARLMKALRPWMKPKIVMGGSIVFLLVFMGVLAPVLSPFDPNTQNLLQTLQAPTWWGCRRFPSAWWPATCRCG